MLFAGVLPEILELLGQRSKWMGSYTSVKGKRWNQIENNLLKNKNLLSGTLLSVATSPSSPCRSFWKISCTKIEMMSTWKWFSSTGQNLTLSLKVSAKDHHLNKIEIRIEDFSTSFVLRLKLKVCWRDNTQGSSTSRAALWMLRTSRGPK